MDRDFREEAQELLTAASDLDDKKAFVLSQEQEMEEYKNKVCSGIDSCHR